jgi:co-chaperonin GroES (HSP10)
MIRAFKNYIFVLPNEDNGSKIFLPPTVKKQMDTAQKGKVMCAGPKAPVFAGEKIVFDKWAGAEITLEGKKVLIIKPNSIYYVEA